MFGGSKITLDKDLLARVRKFADIAGYSSVEEFISHALERSSPSSRRPTPRKRSRRSSRGSATFPDTMTGPARAGQGPSGAIATKA